MPKSCSVLWLSLKQHPTIAGGSCAAGVGGERNYGVMVALRLRALAGCRSLTEVFVRCTADVEMLPITSRKYRCLAAAGASAVSSYISHIRI